MCEAFVRKRNEALIVIPLSIRGDVGATGGKHERKREGVRLALCARDQCRVTCRVTDVVMFCS